MGLQFFFDFLCGFGGFLKSRETDFPFPPCSAVRRGPSGFRFSLLSCTERTLPLLTFWIGIDPLAKSFIHGSFSRRELFSFFSFHFRKGANCRPRLILLSGDFDPCSSLTLTLERRFPCLIFCLSTSAFVLRSRPGHVPRQDNFLAVSMRRLSRFFFFVRSLPFAADDSFRASAVPRGKD